MEDNKKKCSLEKHKDKEAKSYCAKCEKFMCKKCEQFHSEFFESKHSSFIYEGNNFDNFEDYKGISELDQIQKEEDIKYLKEFSTNLNKINDKLNIELEKLNQNKEELIIKIQKYFTKIRNEINQAEDAILIDIDKKYEKMLLVTKKERI